MGVPANLRSPCGLRFKLLDALLCDLHLLLGHSLQSHLAVLVHMDVELVQEVFGLDIRSIFV